MLLAKLNQNYTMKHIFVTHNSDRATISSNPFQKYFSNIIYLTTDSYLETVVNTSSLLASLWLDALGPRWSVTYLPSGLTSCKVLTQGLIQTLMTKVLRLLTAERQAHRDLYWLSPQSGCLVSGNPRTFTTLSLQTFQITCKQEAPANTPTPYCYTSMTWPGSHDWPDEV